MKKFLASVLVSALLLMTMASIGFAAESNNNSFSDIENSYAKDAIIQLQTQGILNGIDGSHFNPKGDLTRAQYVVIMVKALGLTVDASITKSSSFSDVPAWAAPYVEAAFNAGIISGVGGGKFSPNANVTREMAVVILVRALQTKGTVDENAVLDFTDANSISDWAKKYVAIAQKNHLIQGNPDGTFNPKGKTNREMAAVMGVNLLTAIDTIVTPPTPTPSPSPSPEPSPSPSPSPSPTPSTPPVTSGGGGGYTGGGGGGTPIPVTLSSIAITTPATKLIYHLADSLDITGMVVTGAYSNGTTSPLTVTAENISGFDSSKLIDNQKLIVTVGGISVSYTISIVPVVAEHETLLSSPSLTVYADNLNKPWEYPLGHTYKPNTAFQVNVNFNGVTGINFKSAEVSIYAGDTLLATDKAKTELLGSNTGLSDVFGMGDVPATDDTSWIIGGYASDTKPTRVEFRLIDNDDILHIAQADMTPIPEPTVEIPETLLSNPTLTIYAPNAGKEWVYDGHTYPADTAFQVNVNFANGATSKAFQSAEVSIYDDHDVLLATHKAKPSLLDGDYPGLSDVFIKNEPESSGDSSWEIGAYNSDQSPTKVVFKLLGQDGMFHIVNTQITN
jgi:hypothetical protein